jgi:ATP-dependent Clp protease ATP-binding subunit ClpC
MLYFDLKKVSIIQAIKWSDLIFFRYSKLFKKVIKIAFWIFLLLFFHGFVLNNFSSTANQELLGLLIIFLDLNAIYWLSEFFFNTKLINTQTNFTINQASVQPEKYNLAELLSFDLAKAIYRAEKSAKKNQDKFDSLVIFSYLLKNNPDLNFILYRVLLNPKEVIEKLKLLKIKHSDYINNFEEIILESLKIAQRRGNEIITKEDFLIALVTKDLIFKKLLIDFQLKAEDIENLADWSKFLQRRTEEKKQWWQYSNLIKRGSLAKEWTSGFTITLDRFSSNWSETLKNQGFPKIIGHEQELYQMERILSSREENSNVLLIGNTGTGRKSIIQSLAMRSALGQSLPEMNYKVVKELNLPALLAQLQDENQVELTLNKIFEETLLAGNIILVIDQFQNFVGGAEKSGTFDLSGIIAPYLRFPQFQLVAITNTADFRRSIEPKQSLLSLFGIVEVNEISKKEVLMLLENKSLVTEFQNNIFISYPALRNITDYAQRYFPNLSSPEKELEILDESAIYALSLKQKALLPSHVAHIVSTKTQIPVGEIEEKEKTILLHLEDLIHKKIINQEDAVKEVAGALRRARSEITIRKGPMGCFLFLGPTGVGKTETAKALAEIYFGSVSKMIRFDMSEFQNVEDIPRLIGSTTENGLLTDQVRDNPFSLILFDEIEKSNPKILNLLLQVLDEGFLTDGLGRKTHFKDSIIVATSNAGYKIILDAIEKKEFWAGVKKKILDFVFENDIFRPEFINRFDSVVVFKSLTHGNLLDISELMLKKLQQNLLQKDIELVVTQELKEKLVELGYNPIFGAREMTRVIQEKVENVLANAILANKIKRGDKVKILPENFSLEVL